VSVLSLPEVSRQYSKNYVSVHVDLGETTELDERYSIARRHNPSAIHPILVFLDAQGKEVARIKGGLKSKEDALLLDRFVSGKHYLKSGYAGYKAASTR